MIVPALALAGVLAAQATGSAIVVDPHIQTVPYDSNGVVDLRVATGFAAIVEFAPDERVETVVVGNETGWDVSPNRLGNRVIVKPLYSASSTNMVVVTDQRRYVFLIAADRGADAFVLRFAYPARPEQSRRIADYGIRGERTLYPITMSDDGKRTTITWDRQTPLPAIFAKDDHGRESLINGRMIDGDYVIEGVASRYVFRLGSLQAVATRKPVKLSS